MNAKVGMKLKYTGQSCVTRSDNEISSIKLNFRVAQ